MPPTDASADTGTPAAAPFTPGPASAAAPRTVTGADPGTPTDCEDTLDLRLPGELLALLAADGERPRPDGAPERARRRSHGTATRAADQGARGPEAGDGDARGDLLGGVAGWGPVTTGAGVFELVPVHRGRDVPLLSRWMNDPAVAAFWELAGPEAVVEQHLRAQLDGDGRSVPCLGVLDGTPMSYWEIYRADLDPLARHYPARPHDTGIHLLIGTVADRGRGLGTALLTAVADLVLDRRPACGRVVAEPDLRNTPSVSAFLSAGFRYSAEVELPGKRAALMVRDRPLRAVLDAGRHRTESRPAAPPVPLLRPARGSLAGGSR
ncbi:GNAT family N-acetyltransferase [Streptomyces sp. NPDC048566]|uniref:GNAT family N-acetyltransferase n=1 Tax=Streptomyces sp. NPDC048566 TaxID=3365569 RepID=UPI00371ECBB3